MRVDDGGAERNVGEIGRYPEGEAEGQDRASKY